RGDLEGVLGEPRVVHGVETLLTVLLAPAVLHAPAPRLAVHHVDAGEEHRVGHQRVVVVEPRGLVEREVSVVEPPIVEAVPVPEPRAAGHHLPDVAAKPTRLPAPARALAQLLAYLDPPFEVVDDRAADDFAQYRPGERAP